MNLIAQEKTFAFPVFMIILIFLLFILAIFVFVIFVFLLPWFKGFLSHAQVSILDIIGMRLRRTNVKDVLNNRIASVQAGHPIPVHDLESAAIGGADLKKLTMAFIETQKMGQPFSFEELVDADRKDQLDSLLKAKP